MRHLGYVQFGCGLSAPDSWTNFDASPTLRLQRIPLFGRVITHGRVRFPSNVYYGDIVRGLPIDPATCRAVYSSHILEHLALEDCRAALRNSLTILQPGGILRFVLPDLEYAIRLYQASEAELAAVEFIRSLHLVRETRLRSFGRFLADWLGNEHHRWAWDFKAMAFELRRAGFIDIRRAVMGDSADPRFQEVEDPVRWSDCLGVECRRPPA